MKNHEVLFKNVKKDKDGFAKLLVRFGEWYVPMLGKPLPLTQDDKTESGGEHEITRLNLTRWILKDIPEVATLVGHLADGKESWLFYYNGAEGTWKFWDAPFAGIDEDGEDFDEKIDKLDEMIEEMDDELYRPHYDQIGNMGDEGVHAIYTSDLKKVLGTEADYDPSYDPEDPTGDELDPVVYIKNIPAKIGLARKQHKKLPYEDIGNKVYEMISTTGEDDLSEVGKLFYRLVKELREDV